MEQENRVLPDLTQMERLLKAISNAAAGAIEPGITTHSDLLSAAFTYLNELLKLSQEKGEPEFRDDNAAEIRNALELMILKYGTPTKAVN